MKRVFKGLFLYFINNAIKKNLNLKIFNGKMFLKEYFLILNTFINVIKIGLEFQKLEKFISIRLDAEF
jgi:hypothetical protein